MRERERERVRVSESERKGGFVWLFERKREL